MPYLFLTVLVSAILLTLREHARRLRFVEMLVDHSTGEREVIQMRRGTPKMGMHVPYESFKVPSKFPHESPCQRCCDQLCAATQTHLRMHVRVCVFMCARADVSGNSLLPLG